MIGRFQIQAILGKGAQGVVYRAHDPELDREVAVKTLSATIAGSDALTKEAKVVGRLSHPNLVAVHEMGTHDGRPYVVYEYVEGELLKAVLAGSAPPDTRQSLAWTLQLLDALDHAHSHKVVHRDINPANIIIDSRRAPRIMDFGISALAGTQLNASEGVIGTARYLAPEQLQSGVIGPETDLFSLGLVLYEMLTGESAIKADNAMGAMYEIAHGQVSSPSSLVKGMDPKLDGIVMRALEKSSSHRYLSAAKMKADIEGFVQALRGDSDPSAHDDVGNSGRDSTIAFLMRRMRRNADFPSVASHVAEIRAKTESLDRSKISELSNVVLKDFALSTKLLKLVNSSFYGNYQGRISTISRAVVILGFDQVRLAALSLLLFEHLDRTPQSSRLRESACKAYLSGGIGRHLAREIGKQIEPEEAFVSCMLSDLGRVLTLYYLPDEHAAIEKATTVGGLDEATACRRELGVSFNELGRAVAKEWQLPDSILDSMRQVPEGPVAAPKTSSDHFAHIATYAQALANALTEADESKQQSQIEAVRKRFSKSIPIQSGGLDKLIERAMSDLEELSESVGPDLRQTKAADRVREYLGHNDTEQPAPHTSTVVEKNAGAKEADADLDRKAILFNGIQETTNALLEGVALNQILAMILETIYRGVGCTRVSLCILDRTRRHMSARYALGPDTEKLLKRMKFDLQATNDRFARAVREQHDLTFPSPDLLPSGLPEWYRNDFGAPSFAALPVTISKVCVGLIYCDSDDPSRVIGPASAKRSPHIPQSDGTRDKATLLTKLDTDQSRLCSPTRHCLESGRPHRTTAVVAGFLRSASRRANSRVSQAIGTKCKDRLQDITDAIRR